MPNIIRLDPHPTAASSRTRLLLNVVIDATTGGAFLPLVVLYLSATTTLPSTTVGLVLTVGAAASLPVNPVSGWLVDRVGARAGADRRQPGRGGRVRAAARCGRRSWSRRRPDRDPGRPARLLVRLAGPGLRAAVPRRVARLVVRPGQRHPRRLHRTRLGRRSGPRGHRRGRPAALAAPGRGRRLAALSAPAERRPLARTPADDRRSRGAPRWGLGWRDVLSVPFLLLTASNTALTYAWLLLGVALPLYLVSTVALPAWLPSAALALNTVVVVLAQRPLTARAQRHRRTRTVALGAAFFAVAFVLFASLGLVADAPAGVVGAGTVLVVGVVVHAVGECLVGPAASATVLALSPVGLRGRYSAMFQTSWTISTITGPVAIAALLAWSGFGGWSVMATVIGLGGIAFLLCEPRLPPHALRPVHDRLSKPAGVR